MEVFTVNHILLALAVAVVVSVLLVAHFSSRLPEVEVHHPKRRARFMFHSMKYVGGVIALMLPSCAVVFLVMVVTAWVQ